MRTPREEAPSAAEPVPPGTVTPDPPPPPDDEAEAGDIDLRAGSEEREPDQDVNPEAATPEPPD